MKVDTDQLRSVGAAFTAAGDKLAAVQAETPLGDAASAVPSLQTAAACNAAKSAVAEQMTAIADGALTFGANVVAAAEKYESTDQASGNNIAGVNIPGPSS
ncbi:type VII secretion target [Mycolicibacterium chubuense]|uniref:type VII secretion target n=1 Tax=Mycolicibacterium chubuense TaxID=1800 RepID=UPI001EF048E3|nr:type VII secretion target [Mycolicibacterium chubuense]